MSLDSAHQYSSVPAVAGTITSSDVGLYWLTAYALQNDYWLIYTGVQFKRLFKYHNDRIRFADYFRYVPWHFHFIVAKYRWGMGISGSSMPKSLKLSRLPLKSVRSGCGHVFKPIYYFVEFPVTSSSNVQNATWFLRMPVCAFHFRVLEASSGF